MVQVLDFFLPFLCTQGLGGGGGVKASSSSYNTATLSVAPPRHGTPEPDHVDGTSMPFDLYLLP